MKIQQITETAVSKTNRSRNEIGYKNWNEIQRAVRHSSSNPSDPRHSARLTIDGREVVISKQSAEQLFRWLKKNFKTKHERELYDFLTHQRLLGVLDDNQNLTENKIDMNSLDSWTFDQTSAGWRSLPTFEMQIDALKKYIKTNVKNHKFINPGKNPENGYLYVNPNTVYWHLGQVYACNNNIPLAIRWMKKTAEIEPSWTAYANGTIAFLNKRRKEFEYWAKKEEINKSVFDRLRKHWDKSYFDAYHSQDHEQPDTTKQDTDVDKLNELAPSKPGDNGGDEDFDEDTLKQYAAQWWRGNDAQQKKIERTLHFSGYEIGHDEGYDNGGVFVIRVGDTHGSSYLSWSAEDLEQLNEFVQGDDDRDNRPERPLSLADVAKIIKARLGSDWTMQRIGRTEQPGYKFIPTDKTKHGMAKIWCLVDWNKVGEYPTYNTILFAYEQKDGKIMANGRQTERAKHKSVSNALETARLILNNKGGLKDVVSEGDYSDEEIERYGPELIQRQRNLDLLASVFGYQNIHRVARALRAGNLKRRLRHNEGTPEERAQYSRAVRILDSMTDESGNIMPHTDTTVYRQK